jgi:DivIVA domain-containing protein
MGVDQTSLDRIRNATFPSSRRGYDKHEVEKFLGRLADWLETGGGDESRSDAVKRELKRVGERTGAILAQAEESAQQIRAEAEDEARGTVNTANLEATETRTEADNYATERRAAADQQAQEAIEQAQAQARRIVEEANQRREDMEALLGDLIRRREDVIADTEELSRKLSAAVEQHRSEELRMPEPLIEAESDELPIESDSDEVPIEPESEETQVAPASQETQEHSITTEQDAVREPEDTQERDAPEQPRTEPQDLRT